MSGSNEVVTKYYSAGSSRIAYRINGTITWLLNDHLGSMVGTVDEDGELIGVLKYTAYGELRTGSSTTDYRYTGQREESEIRLYFYVARFYDPAVGRFISADTIVPDPGSSQGYDRFSYVSNNPINRNDPSGHCYDEDGDGNCDGRGYGVVPADIEIPNTIVETTKDPRIVKPTFGLSMEDLLELNKQKDGSGFRTNLDYSPGLENFNALYETGTQLKLWKGLPAISPILSGVDQLYRDRNKNYDTGTELLRVWVAVGMDSASSAMAGAASALVMGAFVETGPESLLAGGLTYYSVSVLSAPCVEAINEYYIFPELGID